MTLTRFRRLVGAYVAVYLVVRAPAFWSLADARADGFDPVGVMAWLDAPVSKTVLITTWVIALVFAAAVAFDFKAGLTGPVFAVAVLVLFTYRSSWGQILWFEHLPALHALIVGLTVGPSKGSGRSDGGTADEPSWPVELAAIVTVTTYVLAGIAKLRIGGVEWLADGSLGNHIAYSAARLQVLGGTPSPIAEFVVSLGPILTPAGGLALLLELAAPLALVPRLRLPWVIGAWVMHTAIAASMFVVFSYPLFLIAFAPLWRPRRRVASE